VHAIPDFEDRLLFV